MEDNSKNYTDEFYIWIKYKDTKENISKSIYQFIKWTKP